MTARGGSRPEPVYLVRGDDAILTAQRARALVHRLLGDDDQSLALEEHGGEELDVGAVVTSASTPPFLSERRVLVVRQAGKLRTQEVDALIAYLEVPLASTSLVLVAEGGSVPAKLSNAVKKAGEVIDTTVGRGRQQWLSSRVRSSPVQLEAAALSRLDDHVGEDLWRVEGILDTLAVAFGEGARLRLADMEPFLGQAGGVAPWDLTDAIEDGDTKTALEVLHRMMEGGQRHPLILMSTLQRTFANMLRLDGADVGGDDDAAALLGTRSTFPARKALAQSRRLGSEAVGTAIVLLADADLDLRGDTAWPAELIMEVLVARLSRLSRSRRPGRRAASSASASGAGGRGEQGGW